MTARTSRFGKHCLRSFLIRREIIPFVRRPLPLLLLTVPGALLVTILHEVAHAAAAVVQSGKLLALPLNGASLTMRTISLQPQLAHLQSNIWKARHRHRVASHANFRLSVHRAIRLAENGELATA